MKHIIIVSALIFSSFMVQAQQKITISANGESKTATLADTQAARELYALLEEAPIAVSMSDYGGFEKVGSLPQSFTTNDRQTTTSAGDIMLYLGRNIVIFYGSNSWAYTPLGHIDDASSDEIRSFLAGSSVEVTLSISDTSSLELINTDRATPIVYTLQGVRIDLAGGSLSSLPSGIYIVNGKKIRIN